MIRTELLKDKEVRERYMTGMGERMEKRQQEGQEQWQTLKEGRHNRGGERDTWRQVGEWK